MKRQSRPDEVSSFEQAAFNDARRAAAERGFSKEMQDAIREDAAKLSAMTGEEHTVEFFSTPWDSEPVAWRVIAGPNFRPFHCSSRADAEQVAHNYLTYVRGCTVARIEPLYAGQAETIQPRTYGVSEQKAKA